MMVRQPNDRAGFTIVLVVIVVTILALSAYTFTFWLTQEAEALIREGQRSEAARLTTSGAALFEAIDALAADPRDQRIAQNEELFQGVVVQRDESEGSPTDLDHQRLAIYVRDMTPDATTSATGETIRFGVEREAGRVHLNAWFARDQGALRQALLKLPLANEALADAVLDWLDSDDEPRPAGAEKDFYETLPGKMVVRNGPVASLDELLLVKGMTPTILFGEDSNQNGRLDPNEDDGVESPPDDNQDGVLDGGWADFLTIYSRESMLDRLGKPRLWLNQSDLGQLYSELRSEFDEDVSRFVFAYRLLGPAGANLAPADPGSEKPIGRHKLRSLFELVDAPVEGQWEGDAIDLSSPFKSSDVDTIKQFAKFAERVTVLTDDELVGRLDVFSCREPALALLTRLDEGKRKLLVDARPTPSGSGPGNDNKSPINLVWLLEQRLLTKEELMDLEPKITVNSPVIRFRAMGFSDGKDIRSEWEYVFDRSSFPHRMLLARPIDRFGARREMTLFGRGGDVKSLPKLEPARADDENVP